jgi:dTDP-glucose pyrophosphorylase
VNVGDVLIHEGATLFEVLERITRGSRQVALVVDDDARLVGLVTDGDLRKAILRGLSLDTKVTEAMNRTPVVGAPGVAADEALALMRSRTIRHLPLVDAAGRVIDLVRLEDLIAPPPPLAIRAVIMAGGAGTRLRPLTESTPKPLLRVGGKVLIEVLIERLRQSGIGEVIVTLHHKAEVLRESLGDGRRLGVHLEYVEEPRPLGTVGSLPLLRDRLDRPFLVVNADILTKCDFRAMWDFHRAEGVEMTVGFSLHQVEIPYGEFTLRGSRVTRVQEKPRKEIPINAGIYLLEPTVVDAIPAGEAMDATDLIGVLLAQERAVAAYPIREYWLDVGRHPDLEKAHRDVADGLLE